MSYLQYVNDSVFESWKGDQSLLYDLCGWLCNSTFVRGWPARIFVKSRNTACVHILLSLRYLL
jgi:hypothetical protein